MHAQAKIKKCDTGEKYRTIYGMVNNIMFEIDTLEKDVIKRKIMP